ncbi:hypothetical protein JXA85_06580 [Candidatus Woesearchaeota archaeon]|nr:hypothetical protein [Candidatus Woesearchaeota archaeon]
MTRNISYISLTSQFMEFTVDSDIFKREEVVEMYINEIVKNETTTPGPSDLYTPKRNSKYDGYARAYYFPFYEPGCH